MKTFPLFFSFHFVFFLPSQIPFFSEQEILIRFSYFLAVHLVYWAGGLREQRNDNSWGAVNLLFSSKLSLRIVWTEENFQKTRRVFFSHLDELFSCFMRRKFEESLHHVRNVSSVFNISTNLRWKVFQLQNNNVNKNHVAIKPLEPSPSGPNFNTSFLPFFMSLFLLKNDASWKSA